MDEKRLNRNKHVRSQRHRNQRDKRKHQDDLGESVSGNNVPGNNVSDPQPQRTNRRQLATSNPTPLSSSTEVSNTTATINATDTSSLPPSNKDEKEIKEKETVTIDFSNLKRETEEIAKLTKKYAKRNISSNWQRYSAPEEAEREGEMEDESPADFSALIQVTSSKGGHLQLKDEQEWTSASNEQLGGYFALDLKLLNQSLACIPLYEQLRLSKLMFTEEEIKHFDALASAARRVYNPDKVENPNESVMKTLTTLLRSEKNAEMENMETKLEINTSTNTSLIHVNENKENLLNIDLPPEIICENSPQNNCDLSKFGKVSDDKNKSSLIKVDLSDGSAIELNSKNIDLNISVEETKTENKLLLNSPMNNATSKVEVNQVSKDVDQINLTKQSTDKTKSILINNTLDSGVKSEIKTHKDNVGVSELNKLENSLILEDDDDLDFLLSLKKPAQEENKNLKTVKVKDSTVEPGSGATIQALSSQQHSELDDWLDSVLQD